MNFNNQMFNPQYINPQYYYSVKDEITSDNDEQCKEIANAVKAIHDLCEAVKRLDSQHQQTAFYACLAEMARQMSW